MQPLNHYKTNRLWNINANIVVADILSTAGTALIIEAIRAKLPLIDHRPPAEENRTTGRSGRP